MIKKFEKYNDYLDFYENLLTDNQRNVANDYYREDLSLQEIADNQGVSKNAIYDSLKRTEKLLKGYEAKLHLVKQHQVTSDFLSSLEALNNEEINKLIKKYQEEIYE